MKKSLVLAMAMALGVTASAYAANPFSDVPAGHWAYDSVNKLASAGIVDGYGNGTFGGDRLMTRYEMAQIVAKAMAKGANVDRLAVERRNRPIISSMYNKSRWSLICHTFITRKLM